MPLLPKTYRSTLDLKLAYYKFLLSIPENASDETLKDTLREGIEQNNMAPWYEIVCTDLKWEFNHELFDKMELINQQNIRKLNQLLEINFDEVEKTDIYLKVGEYYSSVGNKEKALEIFQHIIDQTNSTSKQGDIIFNILRIGFFFKDYNLIKKYLKIGNKLIVEDGSWDAKQTLKLYESLYCIATKDFAKACDLIWDTINWFTNFDIVDYKTYISYAILTSLVSLPRNEIYQRIAKNAEILEVLPSESVFKKIIISFHKCKFNDFFLNLSKIETILKNDYFFHLHYISIVKELRVLAYSQVLVSYKSLSLHYIAATFGVTVEYIENDLSKFICMGKLHCKINKVNGIVETCFPNSRNSNVELVIKKGDELLNKIQKLSKVVHF